MICSYHSQNVAVVNCNGCGRPLCPACDHRIKGFPFCQDCIVNGVELLRNQNESKFNSASSRRTSPFVAVVLSFICPGLGAAYNGQTVKALVHFAIVAALFQLAVMTGLAIFVVGFLGMWWFFVPLDAWKTAKLIRSGVKPNEAEDVIVQRISSNPKLSGLIVTGLGLMFVLHSFLGFSRLIRGVLPLLLIVLGVYLLRDYVFKSRKNTADEFAGRQGQPRFISAVGDSDYPAGRYDTQPDYQAKPTMKTWKNP